jgi:hypothetical protein
VHCKKLIAHFFELGLASGASENFGKDDANRRCLVDLDQAPDLLALRRAALLVGRDENVRIDYHH